MKDNLNHPVWQRKMAIYNLIFEISKWSPSRESLFVLTAAVATYSELFTNLALGLYDNNLNLKTVTCKECGKIKLDKCKLCKNEISKQYLAINHLATCNRLNKVPESIRTYIVPALHSVRKFRNNFLHNSLIPIDDTEALRPFFPNFPHGKSFDDYYDLSLELQKINYLLSDGDKEDVIIRLLHNLLLRVFSYVSHSMDNYILEIINN